MKYLPKFWLVFVALFISLSIISNTHAQYNSCKLVYSDIRTTYAVTIDKNGHIYAGGKGGVYYSTDNGNAWSKISNMSTTFIKVNSLGYIYVISSGNVCRFKDNGLHWRRIRNGN
jgi:hypothetical protein